MVTTLSHRCVNSIVIISQCLRVSDHHVVYLNCIHFICALYLNNAGKKKFKKICSAKNKRTKEAKYSFCKGHRNNDFTTTNTCTSVSRIYHNTIVENYNLKAIREPSPYPHTVSFQNPHLPLLDRQPHTKSVHWMFF